MSASLIGPETSWLEVGREASSLLVIDDFHSDPERLIDEAESMSTFSASESDYYPGVKRLVLPHYANSLERYVDQISQVFGSPSKLQDSRYAVVNVDANALLPIQRIPHYDTVDSDQLALVHYLCSSDHGGTAFYRHCSTGFERIHAARTASYQRALGREATTLGLPSADYPADGGKLHKRLEVIPAKFNRALIYPASLLHSGYRLGASIKSGSLTEQRLTITSSVRVGVS